MSTAEKVAIASIASWAVCAGVLVWCCYMLILSTACPERRANYLRQCSMHQQVEVCKQRWSDLEACE